MTIFLQCQGSFINHFPKLLATNTVIQTAFAITTKNSFKSDERPVILTAFVVIYNEFQKCDACRSVIQKLYNIQFHVIPVTLKENVVIFNELNEQLKSRKSIIVTSAM